jgi:Nucleotidyl transferase AbiEii toxin, Type IV TA system
MRSATCWQGLPPFRSLPRESFSRAGPRCGSATLPATGTPRTWTSAPAICASGRLPLQTAVNLDRRDWTNRARDLYDLWWLHENHAPVAWAELRGPLDVKVAARGVAFTGSADFLDPRVLRSYRDSWNVRLANVVPNLPPFDEALTALLAMLGQVFATEPPRVSLG